MGPRLGIPDLATPFVENQQCQLCPTKETLLLLLSVQSEQKGKESWQKEGESVARYILVAVAALVGLTKIAHFP